MVDLLFVYGTLRGGFENPHARRLRRDAVPLGNAIRRGSIFRIGVYPGYRPLPDGEVHGELYRITNPQSTLGVLDDYEGSEFERVLLCDAWIYQLKWQPPECDRIESGDFCQADRQP